MGAGEGWGWRACSAVWRGWYSGMDFGASPRRYVILPEVTKKRWGFEFLVNTTNRQTHTNTLSIVTTLLLVENGAGGLCRHLDLFEKETCKLASCSTKYLGKPDQIDRENVSPCVDRSETHVCLFPLLLLVPCLALFSTGSFIQSVVNPC